MSNYTFSESKFGNYDTIILKDETAGTFIEVARQGCTLLNYSIPLEDGLYNIIDGFRTPEELAAARGARCWIMTPFANRIPNGIYNFKGKEYKLKPLPPRSQVIHGFTSYEIFKIVDTKITDNFAEVILLTDAVRPGVFEGYPFSLNVYIKFRLEKRKLSIEVTGENIGSEPLPFGPGWHPYLKTNDESIEDLIVTIDADKLVLMDENLIPLKGDKAFGELENYPEADFRSVLPEDRRILNGRKLDQCYSGVKFNKDNYAYSSIYDKRKGLKIVMFQEGGVTLAFSGDSLSQRARKSIALEPMSFITNAFNRPELEEKLTVLPGDKKTFRFGLTVVHQ